MSDVITDLTDVFFACRTHMKLRIRISEDVEEFIKRNQDDFAGIKGPQYQELLSDPHPSFLR